MHVEALAKEEVQKIEPLGKEEEEETEEEAAAPDTVVYNASMPPQLEWIITNTHYRLKIRIWNANDPNVRDWAFEMFERSLKAVRR